ncbi:ABC transporter substrate-binding protein [Rhizobium mesoamericanum]|uniref:Extracellular solute-binding protein, family 1 n=1 Tax=Rhizobium mesoamericanum STM3625 TaxID=1211777 RepID=K0Q1V0_9HYPH|nr:extracellular solute-binding protein [Rhizobium mesoamericanum]CCM78290.1 Extracellular solute-binding protein, family 1 [Rhizobium mesoamericanum STM3625]
MFSMTRRSLMMAALMTSTVSFTHQAFAGGGEVTISHYFTGELGLKAFAEQVAKFEEATGIKMKDSPVGHEDFKTDILVRAAGHSLPDVFSYWAGARVAFIVKANSLAPLDDLWAKNNLDGVVSKTIAKSATIYDGKRFLIPFNYHYAGIFFNRKVLADAGVTEMPAKWEDFIALCKKLKEKGVTPIALGSKNRWPAQFWFDYLLLRTAGPEYRAKLMAGEASYDDAEVINAMKLWRDLLDVGFFVQNANADDWTDAADKVARGDAAMTLMGTWITGYWDGVGLKAGEDYDFFPFPSVKDGVPNAAVGPVDGLVMSANAKNPEGAQKFLSFMMTNADVQANWAKAQGALSANVNVDPKTYNVVMQKAAKTVSEAPTFAFNYDLATPPPVAEVGLSMFSRFIDDPSKLETVLKAVAPEAKKAFAE